MECSRRLLACDNEAQLKSCGYKKTFEIFCSCPIHGADEDHAIVRSLINQATTFGTLNFKLFFFVLFVVKKTDQINVGYALLNPTYFNSELGIY